MQRQAATAEDPLLAQDLHGSLTPAKPLDVVRGRGLRGEPESENLVVVRRFPTLRVHPHRGVPVLSDRLCGEAADVLEGCAAHDPTRTAEEGRVPTVLSRLDDPVEERLLVPTA